MVKNAHKLENCSRIDMQTHTFHPYFNPNSDFLTSVSMLIKALSWKMFLLTSILVSQNIFLSEQRNSTDATGHPTDTTATVKIKWFNRRKVLDQK